MHRHKRIMMSVHSTSWPHFVVGLLSRQACLPSSLPLDRTNHNILFLLVLTLDTSSFTMISCMEMIVPITGPLWGESTIGQSFPSQKANNTLMFSLLLVWTSCCLWFETPQPLCDITMMSFCKQYWYAVVNLWHFIYENTNRIGILLHDHIDGFACVFWVVHNSLFYVCDDTWSIWISLLSVLVIDSAITYVSFIWFMNICMTGGSSLDVLINRAMIQIGLICLIPHPYCQIPLCQIRFAKAPTACLPGTDFAQEDGSLPYLLEVDLS